MTTSATDPRFCVEVKSADLVAASFTTCEFGSISLLPRRGDGGAISEGRDCGSDVYILDLAFLVRGPLVENISVTCSVPRDLRKSWVCSFLATCL